MANWSIRHYNNKGRKGDYFVFTRGKKTYRVKLDPAIPLDIYVNAAERGATGKTIRQRVNTWRSSKPQAKSVRTRYRNMLKRKGKLSDNFGRGSTKYTTTLEKMQNPAERDKMYTALFTPLLLDKTLLPAVIRGRENLRHRFSYILDIIGTDKQAGKRNVPLGQIIDVGNRTPDEIFGLYAIQNRLRSGTHIDGNMLNAIGKNARLPAGAVTSYTYDGIIQDVKIEIRFQRG